MMSYAMAIINKLAESGNEIHIIERNELKNKTGIIVNEYGEKLNDLDDSSPSLTQTTETTQQPSSKIQLSGKSYTPITSYKPSGNLVYANDLLNKLEKKTQ